MSFDLKLLSSPFLESDIEWRITQSGFSRDGKPWANCVPYVTARAVMDRMDEVCGPDRWSDKYEFISTPSGVLCTLSVLTDDGWVAKQNGSEPTDIEAFKGAISKAFVRTAVNWGIGRYLYNTGQHYAVFTQEKTDYRAKIKDKTSGREDWVYWIPPRLSVQIPEKEPSKAAFIPADTITKLATPNAEWPPCPECHKKMIKSKFDKGPPFWCPECKNKKKAVVPPAYVDEELPF